MKYLFTSIIISNFFCASSQLVIGGNNPDDFVANVLSSNNVSVSNVSYSGYNGAICYFSANVQNMPFSSGLLMTTGKANNAAGPNNQSNAEFDNNYSGYAPLNNMLHTSTFNAAVISFDVIPYGDTLKIKYIFASEEYPEYVGSEYVDGFAIFISGPGIIGTQNIAHLPNGMTITVNNINNGNPGGTGSGVGYSLPVNPQYFVTNGDGNQAPFNSSDTYLQYDGLTVPLTAKSTVIPGQTYHITLAIADAGDATSDSGVFLEEGGITAGLDKNTMNECLNIYYNSSGQEATIKIKECPENLNYSVVDLSGKIMSQSGISETTSIDFSQYSPGMYLISVEGTNERITQKVIR